MDAEEESDFYVYGGVPFGDGYLQDTDGDVIYSQTEEAIVHVFLQPQMECTSRPTGAPSTSDSGYGWRGGGAATEALGRARLDAKT